MVGGELERQIGGLRQGDHFCLIYETVTEQMAVVVPFVQDGLARRERCVYITDDRTAEEVVEALTAAGVDVARERERGALWLLTQRDAYLRSGEFDPQAMIRLLHQTMEQVLVNGFTGLRVTGEMTWALGSDVGCARLIEAEALLNDFFPGSRSLAICQYRRSRFSPETIHGVLRTHPTVILGDQVCPNLYYEPSEMILGRESPTKQVDWMIAQLERGRAAEQALQELNGRFAAQTTALEAERRRRKHAEEEHSRLLRQEQAARAEAEAAQRWFTFLAEAGKLLAASLDYETTLDHVAHLAVPTFADFCAVDLLEEDHMSIRRLAVAHVNPAKEAVLRAALRPDPLDLGRPHPVVKVLRTGQPELVREVSDLLLATVSRDAEQLGLHQQLSPKSLMVVPLVAQGQTLGAMTFVSAESGRRYDPADLLLAEELAHHAALAIDNARLYRQRSEIARTLQQSLLPPQLPAIPGIELAARYRPAGEGIDVGGDFYDLFETGEGAWAIVIGDVMGKGTAAAAVTALARHTVRAVSRYERQPSRILTVLNEAILQERPDEGICTVAYVRLEPTADGSRLTMTCAGHPLPLLLRRDGSVEPIGRPGTLLGVLPAPWLTDQVAELEPGDVLVLYTDGVTEARSGRELFGEERLTTLVGSCAGLSAAHVVERIERTLVEFQGGNPHGDIALLVLRARGPSCRDPIRPSVTSTPGLWRAGWMRRPQRVETGRTRCLSLVKQGDLRNPEDEP
jgi:serine phosphatase RsbU (regulator of sigma subunit)